MNRQNLVLCVVAAVLLGLAAKYLLRPNPHNQALRAREVATRGLAEYLARTQPGKRALVVANPFTQRKDTAREIIETEEAALRGLREGFGGKIAIGAVAYPELKPAAIENPRSVAIDPETTTPLSYLVAPDAFDELSRAHPDCEFIVSLIGLPADLKACEAWQAEGAPRFALLLPDLRMLGGPEALRRAMKSDKLVAFLLRKPGGWDDHRPVGKNFREEFEKRFLLVTAENVGEITRTLPNFF